MGNAGSTSMSRERHKSTDLSTPNSPFREIPGSTVSAQSAAGIGGSLGSVVVGGVSNNSGGVGAAFTFDKKPDTRSVLHGGSSQEDEEPYYTKTLNSVDSELATATPQKRRSSTVSESTSVVSNMSRKSESTDADAQDDDQLKNPALPTVLRWDGGGKNVMISGTFSNWKAIPMVRSHGNFVTIIDLPEGDHQYKFCVDGEWKFDPKLVSVS